MKYNVYDRELLAVCNSLKFFRYIDKDRKLTIKTDYRLLTYAF